MCLCVNANGRGAGTGNYVSVYVDLMRGEHDHQLVWPCQGVVTFQLLNQKSDQKHVEWTANFIRFTGCGERVTAGERANRALGSAMFISHSAVEFITETTQYLHNDCLKWRIVLL